MPPALERKFAVALTLALLPALLAGPSFAGPPEGASDTNDRDVLAMPQEAAGEEIMSLQAAGPPDSASWTQAALDSVTQTSLNAPIGTAAAVGHVKIDRNSVYQYYDERVAPPQSTYTPLPTYP